MNGDWPEKAEVSRVLEECLRNLEDVRDSLEEIRDSSMGDLRDRLDDVVYTVEYVIVKLSKLSKSLERSSFE